MKLFLLGAGKPAHGDKPTALKCISTFTTALDWQIHSFESIINIKDIHFLGGYHVDEIIEKYPSLNFSIIPDWENKSILNTLFSAPFADIDVDAVISYSDTVFHKSVIKKLLSFEADVVVGFDSSFKERFQTRSLKDINNAETLFIDGNEVEFTGLTYLSKKALEIVSRLEVSNIGNNIIDLIKFFKKKPLLIKLFDVEGEWAEFNHPDDVAKFILGTKAETLARLEPLVKKSHIGKQIGFTALEWQHDKNIILNKIIQTFKGENLVIRSSAKGEDNWHASNAGGFDSILNVDITNQNEIIETINTVITSYGSTKAEKDQILIQAFLTNVRSSGVVFTCGLESGSPYYCINFDDITQSTESVTSGKHGDLRTVIISRLNTQYLNKIESDLNPVLEAVVELEELLGFDKLDIEFAIDENGKVHIFQVRPITVSHSEYDVDIDEIKKCVENAKNSFITQQKSSPFIFGENTILANMPDWNPAEIIGTRPKPLAFSLYREIITNDIWAQQRAEFGYCDVRPYPLIISLSGQPYVDVRASFNSFVPNNISSNLKSKLVNAYTKILYKKPQLHDKIEFDIVYTIWTQGFSKNAIKRLSPYNINENEINQLECALKNITKNALLRLNNDISSISLLEERREKTLLSDLSTLDKVFVLLDDCKKFGTLAFSHAARAGFVATTFLNSLVENNHFTENRKHEFLMSFNTVAGDFEEDKYLYSSGKLSLYELTRKYGHLRPGTYELHTSAYWENPTQYLIPENANEPKKLTEFILTDDETVNIENMLLELGSSISVDEFLNYLKESIQAREFVKFVFTKNLSKALDLINKLGKELGIKRKDLSYLEYNDLEQLKLNVISVKSIKKSIKNRKKNFLLTQLIELPPLIKDISDFYCFERYSSEPNFVTVKKVEASIYKFDTEGREDMSGKIILIPQADPGYDWLFGYGISGLITQYGGANSHMAIRSAEIDLPSAIGVGEKLYEKISMMRKVELDCSGRTIREIT